MIKDIGDGQYAIDMPDSLFRTNGTWVPVTNRLPEPDTDVLVMEDGGDIGIGYLSNNGPWWVASGASASVESDLGPVTHWMPLPERPK